MPFDPIYQRQYQNQYQIGDAGRPVGGRPIFTIRARPLRIAPDFAAGLPGCPAIQSDVINDSCTLYGTWRYVIEYLAR